MAKRRRVTYKKKSENSKRMLWFILGMLTGIMLTLLFHHQLPSLVQFAKNKSPATAKKTTTVKPEKSKTPEFDFYSMLPKNQYPTPTATVETAPSISEKEKITQQQPKTNLSSMKKMATLYYLQAAAFKNAQDADQMKAQLILAGYDVSIKTTIKDKNNDALHRVYVGPYPNKKRAIIIQKRLKAAHVNTILVRDNAE